MRIITGAWWGAAAAAAAALAGLGACDRQTDLDPPMIVQFTCTFGTGSPPMTVVIDTGLRAARWMSLSTPREGRLRVSPHLYELDFPALTDKPAVRAVINRYDGTIQQTLSPGDGSERQAGRCVKEKTGPRL